MDAFIQDEKRAKKWIWGCTGGCLGSIVIAAAIIGIGVYVLMRPVPVVPPEVFLGPEATLFLCVRIEPDDPLMVEVPYRLALQPSIRQLVPIKDDAKFWADAEQCRGAVLDVAPIQMVVILYPGDEKAPFHGGIVFSIYKGSRFIRLAMRAYLQKLRQRGAALSEYREADIAEAKEGPVIAVRANNFMAANQKTLVKSWIDRLAQRRALEEAGPSAEVAPRLDAGIRLKAAYERLDRHQPVLLASLNAHGEVARLLELLCPQEDLRELLTATGVASESVLSIGALVAPLNATDAALKLFVECADDDSAAALQKSLKLAVEQAGHKLPLQKVEIRRHASLLHIDATIADAPEKLAALAGHIVGALQQRGRLGAPPG